MSRHLNFLFFLSIFTTLVGAATGAKIVVRDQIDVVYDHGTRLGTEVDHWFFRQNSAGPVRIDIMAYEAQEGPFERPIRTQDLNKDGEITLIDTYIYLFRDDGDLDESDEIAHNDGGTGTYLDGSIYVSDSFLSLNLDPGEYILAIGSYVLTVENAVEGLNTDPYRGGFFYPLTVTNPLEGTHYGDTEEYDHADYTITFSGDLEMIWPGDGRTIFPQAVFGGDWRTILSVTNPDSMHSADIEMRVYDQIGSQLRAEDISLSPLETRRFTFTESTEQPISGYLVLEHNRGIASSARYEGRNAADEIEESVGVIPNADVIDREEFIVDVVYDDKINTGIALVPDDVEEIESGQVLATLYDDSGTKVGETTLSVPKHFSKFVPDFFPTIEKPFQGYLTIRHGGSYDRVHAIALLIEYRADGWELTSLPVHPGE